MVCHSELRRTFRNMSQENAWSSGLAFSTVCIVDLIKYIVIASPSSTSVKHLEVFGVVLREVMFSI